MEFNPESKNEECVGPSSEMAGKVSGCSGCPNQSACASGKGTETPSNEDVISRMSLVKHKILVLSGKGGVGKSTVSAQLAFTLASRGYQVGLLDVDICGPSIPRMLGLVGQEVHSSASGWSPVYVEDNLAVMSIGFMLPSQDDAIIWRGPRKTGLIKQFLTDVVWNELDYLIIDTPPGTSDEHISIVQLLKSAALDGAVVVTTPQEVAMADVRKELNFCKKTSINVIGIVENMSNYRLPLNALLDPTSQITFSLPPSISMTSDELLMKIQAHVPELFSCSIDCPLLSTTTESSIRGSTNPQQMAASFDVPYLGSIPFDPNLTRSCEMGKSFIETFPISNATQPLNTIVDKIIGAIEPSEK